MSDNIKENKKYSVGICIGASTVSYVQLEKTEKGIVLLKNNSIIHEGSPKKVLMELLPLFKDKNISVIVTGRKFKNLINTYSIPEPEAVEYALEYLKLKEKYGVIASLGGENFIVYCLNDSGKISDIITGNKCASGTGEFFLQQIGRMNLNLEDALNCTNDNSPYQVSGRCSVFCKSDCTHALNKGVFKGNVVSGLSKMIADKVIELLSKQNSDSLLVIGGVSKNRSVINFLRKNYPNLFIPDEAAYFEALGAAVKGLDVYSPLPENDLFLNPGSAFPTLPPLMESIDKVTFKSIKKSEAKDGDECIIGLDVGSTTTKAVLLNKKDDSLLASVYTRTNGNPVEATIECYKELKKQINAIIKIVGLGTTGSGRHISALYSTTEGVINEIIAHAVAAAHFDKEVDTILEIGGQDAKYTYLTNGIASDYAMNEACSAGTGSFLEEAAKESLGIYYKDIGELALKSKTPLNFNDQCSAFISSDIKNASHDGANVEDITAGLVYSVCMNYNNRVKGNRPVGKKVFMQGGVCYNKAIPIAMSYLINKEIIVPPEPGLMGAFGVALEIKNRLNKGLLKYKLFDFESLITREFKYKNEFICAGGSEKCDRKCSVSLIEVDGKMFPFGGACNKYYNIRNDKKINVQIHDRVKTRQIMVFEKYLDPVNNLRKASVGISKSFMTNTLYPLYFNFFNSLGFDVVLADKIDPDGIDKIRSSFCYPVEIAHGLFQDLINRNVDYIFLPHITQMQKTDFDHNKLCVFVQGESYYLKSAFEGEKLPRIISPVFDFSWDIKTLENAFIKTAVEMGANAGKAKEAFRYAYNKLQSMYREFKETGRQIISDIEKSNDEFGIVLFGRSYNSFTSEANLNIPHKFASKGITIFPHDFIPSENLPAFENMYWFSGQQILRSARYVEKHPKLFGVYITNFSCGPDSFIIPYFRKIMGRKPSLTLELDSHSADVGIDTRIDAALDIFHNYLELKQDGFIYTEEKKENGISFYSDKKEFGIIDSSGNKFKLDSEQVEVLVPSMGRFGTEIFARVFNSYGINSKPLPIPTFDTLQHGRSMASCKECLPFILTTGSLIEYVKDVKPEKNVLFFMPFGHGPCRQGQYYIMLKEVIKDLGLPNVGVLTMNEEDAFTDLGKDFFRRGFTSLMISDIITDIHNALMVLSEDKVLASEIFEKEWEKILKVIESHADNLLFRQLEEFSETIRTIPLKSKFEDAKVISLVGEIYVRREEFSRGDLIKTLSDNGFIIKTAPICEYVYYSNYLLRHRNHGNEIPVSDRMELLIKNMFQKKIEKKIKSILSKSGLYRFEMIDIDKTMKYGKNLISEELAGETILTVGLSLREILDETCGVISIGPFNCMPSRLSEAILSKEMNLEYKNKINPDKIKHELDVSSLPFLYIETDGNTFPQITQSKIELFMMRAEQLHQEMKKKGKY